MVLNAAYRTLSDPSTRAVFDAARKLFGTASVFGNYTGEPLSKTAKPWASEARGLEILNPKP